MDGTASLIKGLDALPELIGISNMRLLCQALGSSIREVERASNGGFGYNLAALIYDRAAEHKAVEVARLQRRQEAREQMEATRTAKVIATLVAAGWTPPTATSATAGPNTDLQL